MRPFFNLNWLSADISACSYLIWEELLSEYRPTAPHRPAPVNSVLRP